MCNACSGPFLGPRRYPQNKRHPAASPSKKSGSSTACGNLKQCFWGRGYTLHVVFQQHGTDDRAEKNSTSQAWSEPVNCSNCCERPSETGCYILLLSSTGRPSLQSGRGGSSKLTAEYGLGTEIPTNILLVATQHTMLSSGRVHNSLQKCLLNNRVHVEGVYNLDRKPKALVSWVPS